MLSFVREPSSLASLAGAVGGFLFLVLFPASRKMAGALGFGLPGDGAAVRQLQVEIGMPE